jgi:hypothetical protein
VFNELLRTVPRIEEVGVCRNTYLVSVIDECFGVLDLGLGILLVETEAERVGGFLVGVLAEDEILAPDGIVFGMVVDPANVRNFVAGFVSDGVVVLDDSVLRPPRFVALLERTKPLAVEALFVPVVLIEEFVERAFALRLENADVPGMDSESGEYLELHGGRRGAGDTLVREVGWEQAQRLLRHQSPETTMNAYSHISAGEIAEDASDAFDEADGQH